MEPIFIFVRFGIEPNSKYVPVNLSHVMFALPYLYKVGSMDAEACEITFFNGLTMVVEHKVEIVNQLIENARGGRYAC